MKVVVLRPPLVFGPGQKANMLRLMKWVDAGIPLPFASINNRRSLIFVENLVAAIVTALWAAPESAGTYTVADSEVSTPELVRAIAAALNRPARMFAFPAAGLRAAAALVGRRDEAERLTRSLLVDRAEFCAAFDWRPAVEFADALERTAAWYRAQ